GSVSGGEAYHGAGHANGDAGTLRHVRTFGWANGYPVARADGDVSLAFDDQWARRAMLGVALVVWIAAGARWWRPRAPRRPVERVRTERRERPARQDPLAEVLDEDAE